MRNGDAPRYMRRIPITMFGGTRRSEPVTGSGMTLLSWREAVLRCCPRRGPAGRKCKISCFAHASQFAAGRKYIPACFAHASHILHRGIIGIPPFLEKRGARSYGTLRDACAKSVVSHMRPAMSDNSFREPDTHRQRCCSVIPNVGRSRHHEKTSRHPTQGLLSE